MRLQGVNAVAREVRPVLRRQQDLGFAAAVGAQGHGAVAGQRQRSRTAFQKGVAEGAAGVVGVEIQQAVAIENRARASVIVQYQMPRILTPDRRVKAAQIGVDPIGVPQEVSKGVDVMHSRLVDQQARHGLEIRLTRQIGIWPLTVARAQTERQVQRPADPARVQRRLHCPEPWLETEIFVNNERDVRRFGLCRYGLGLFQ